MEDIEDFGSATSYWQQQGCESETKTKPLEKQMTEMEGELNCFKHRLDEVANKIVGHYTISIDCTGETKDHPESEKGLLSKAKRMRTEMDKISKIITTIEENL